jgi:GDPmannose 4,6-dehydratase
LARRAFISGISGQDGAYLSKLLLEKGYEVHGGVRRTGGSASSRLEELGVADAVVLHDFDVLDLAGVQRVLERVAPDEIYNLAAQSFVGASFEQPIHSADVSALGTMRLLECLRQAKAGSRFYQASTSEMFGSADSASQSETTPFKPKSPYGIAKLFAHLSTVNYREAHGLYACSGILFNHESPLRGVEFVTRQISLGLAKIKYGRQPVLELGNLGARRDWGFAGDYVEGMWRILQQPEPDDFVLATGRTTSIREFAEIVAKTHGWQLAWRGEGLSEEGFDSASGQTLVRVNPANIRRMDVAETVGDASKAHGTLGWRHRLELEGLAEMMAEADARRVRDGARYS